MEKPYAIFKKNAVSDLGVMGVILQQKSHKNMITAFCKYLK